MCLDFEGCPRMALAKAVLPLEQKPNSVSHDANKRSSLLSNLAFLVDHCRVLPWASKKRRFLKRTGERTPSRTLLVSP